MTAALQRIVKKTEGFLGLGQPTSKIPQVAQPTVDGVTQEVNILTRPQSSNKAPSIYKIQTVSYEEDILLRVNSILKESLQNGDILKGQDMYYELRADIIYSLLNGYLEYSGAIATKISIAFAAILDRSSSQDQTHNNLDHKLDKLWVHFCGQDIKIPPASIESMETITSNGTAKEYCDAIDQNIS